MNFSLVRYLTKYNIYLLYFAGERSDEYLFRHNKEAKKALVRQNLRLWLTVAKRRDGAWLLVGNLYFPELRFIAHDVVLQRDEETLCMLRSQNDTALHLRLGHTW